MFTWDTRVGLQILFGLKQLQWPNHYFFICELPSVWYHFNLFGLKQLQWPNHYFFICELPSVWYHLFLVFLGREMIIELIAGTANYGSGGGGGQGQAQK